MNAYSYSRLRAWNECPLSFKLNYLDKVGKDEDDSLTLGSAAHEFFKEWVESKCPSEWLPIATKVFTNEPRNQSLFKEFLEICETFVKGFNLEKEILGGSKSSFELKMALNDHFLPVSWDSDEVRLRGIVDRLDVLGNKAAVVDYKTGFFGKPDPFQNSLYAWMLTKYFPEIEFFETIIHYTRTGWKEKASFHKDALGGIEFQLKAMMETVDNDKKFKAKPGSRCSTCFVAFACDKKASKVKTIIDDKSALKIAEDILAGEAQLDAKKDLLKSWISENGELAINGERFGFFPYESVKANTLEIFKVLAAAEKNSFDYLKVDTKEIKKLCREDSGIADALAQHLEFKTTLRFSHKSDKNV